MTDGRHRHLCYEIPMKIIEVERLKLPEPERRSVAVGVIRIKK